MSLIPYQDPNHFLAERRQQLGLSPEELARQIGFPKDSRLAGSMVALIENDRAQIPLCKCREFAAVLEADAVWFTLCLLKKQHPDVINALAPGIPGMSAFTGDRTLADGAFDQLFAQHPPAATFILSDLDHQRYSVPGRAVYVVHKAAARLPVALETALQLPADDVLGVIYIGASDRVWHRLADFSASLRTTTNGSQHPVGLRLREFFDPGDCDLAELLSVAVISADNPKQLEYTLTKAYLEQYGWLPPCNYLTRHHRAFNRLP
jgi:transcriptional regulator with XRE-family HTH domain